MAASLPPGSDPGPSTQEIIKYIEQEISEAQEIIATTTPESRSRRTWAATIRAYQKILRWIREQAT